MTPSLVSEQVPAQILQCAFAQQTAMPLAGPGKFDDALGDDSVCKIVCKAEGRAGHFKCEIQNFFGSGIWNRWKAIHIRRVIEKRRATRLA
jgi:hypothetical protein